MYKLVIHGGAGDLSKKVFNKINKIFKNDIEKKYEDALKECCNIGEKILENNGSAKKAVIECITYLENNELFNSGKGSSCDIKNRYRLEACIMDGKDLSYGSCALINRVKNPIKLADKIMTSKNISKFIAGTDETYNIAKKNNLDLVRETYYKSNYRTKLNKINKDHNYGTVGVVALDKKGNIVAGTSTGGLYNKELGRIGDTAIPNISTFADNKYGGISLTGKGEYIIKKTIAYDIIARMKYKNISMKKALNELNNELEKNKFGVIGIDKINNECCTYFNTKRMFRGVVDKKNVNVAIW